MFVKLRAGAAAGARMQERWRLNAASSYEDPVVRVRKRLTLAIHDLKMQSDFGFLMDAYQPIYLYWEAIELVRKLALVGFMVVLVSS